MIGIKCHSDKYDFDWPTPRQLVNLEPTLLPLVLTQVKLKGITSLEGIQLIFNNGALESPFFFSHDSQPPSPESTQTDSLVSTFDL